MSDNLIKLNDENFELFAMKAYRNYQCTDIEEFRSDVSSIMYLQRTLTKHLNGHPANIRLALNHLITIFNVFEIRSAVRMLFFKLPSRYYVVLKTYLAYLNYLPSSIPDVSLEGIDIDIELFREIESV